MTSKLFYSENELDELGILSRPTRWRLRREGQFPEPVTLSPGRVAYTASNIDAWIVQRREAA